MNLDKTYKPQPYPNIFFYLLTVIGIVFGLILLFFIFMSPEKVEPSKSLSLQVLEACIMNDNDTLKCAMVANEVTQVVTPDEHVPVPPNDDHVNNINSGPAVVPKLVPSGNCYHQPFGNIDPQCEVWHSKEDISTEGDLKQWKHPK